MAEYSRRVNPRRIATNTGLIIVTGMSALSGGCVPQEVDGKDSRESNRPTATSTITPFPTATPTETPIPPEIKNLKNIEQSLEGEDLVLENVTIDKVFKINIRIKELIVGVIKEGDRTIIVKNFDCQFRELREKGLLGEAVDHEAPATPITSWDTSDVVFTELKVEKDADATDKISVITSQSFILGNTIQACEEEPVLQPATNLLKSAWQYIAELTEEIREENK